MAFANTGATVAAPSVVIPMSSIPELTQAELTGANADIRKVFFAISEAFYQSYVTKVNEDRPQRMALNRSTIVNDAQATTSRSYGLTFTVETLSVEVAAEPSSTP